MKPYICGQCGFLYQAIADLHDHLVDHHENIMGYFLHIGNRTAFPKRQYIHVQTQTGEETISDIHVLQNVDQIEIKIENDTFVKTEWEAKNNEFPLDYQYEELAQNNLYHDKGQEINEEGEVKEVDTDFTCEHLQDTKVRIQRNKRNRARKTKNYKRKSTINKDKLELPRREEKKSCKKKRQTVTKNDIETVTYNNNKKQANITVINKYHINKNGDREDVYMCNTCSHISTSEDEIKLHTESHDTQTLEICDSCGKIYPNRTALYSHRRYCLKPHRCKLCKAGFGLLNDLEDHLLVHSGEVPLCDQCGQCFTSRTALVQHKKFIHDLVRNYKCDQCDKTFRGNHFLQRHVRTHQNITPYCCEICGKSFSTKWNLQAHMRQHNGDKPYSCSKCGEKFAHNVSRKTHERKCVFIASENT